MGPAHPRVMFRIEPVPGGPYSSKPFGGALTPVNKSGLSDGSTIISCSAAFASSSPMTSASRMDDDDVSISPSIDARRAGSRGGKTAADFTTGGETVEEEEDDDTVADTDVPGTLFDLMSDGSIYGVIDCGLCKDGAVDC